MSETSVSRITDDEAVPLRHSASEDAHFAPHEEDESATEVEEKPVPVRIGAERTKAEEREARMRVLDVRWSRWR